LNPRDIASLSAILERSYRKQRKYSRKVNIGKQSSDLKGRKQSGFSAMQTKHA